MYVISNKTLAISKIMWYNIKYSGGIEFMALCYNKLWKMLIDKKMSKTELRDLTKISQSTMAKLSKGENINTEIIERICMALNCNIDDIVEYKTKEN